MKRMLGIDFGLKRCGIAITDPLQVVAMPLLTIQYEDENFLFKKILRILDEYKPFSTIVVGLPKNIDNSVSDTGKIILKFIKKLETLIEDKGIEIKTIDEQGTTKAAIEIMREMNISRNDQKEMKDAIAAQKILEFHLLKKH